MSIELLATSIADRAYDRIRADIQRHLDAIPGVVAGAGLVIAEGQRGFRVTPVSPAGFEDVASMRLLLETYALPLSFAAGDLEWESRVVAGCYDALTAKWPADIRSYAARLAEDAFALSETSA